MDRGDFVPARRFVEVSAGESVRVLRELNGLSQEELAALTAIPGPTILAIESGSVPLDVSGAAVLAKALHCNPAVLLPSGAGPGSRRGDHE